MKDISSLSSIYNRIYSDSRNFAVMTLAATRRILLHFRYTPHPQPLKAYCQSPYDEIPVSHLFCYLCTMQWLNSFLIQYISLTSVVLLVHWLIENILSVLFSTINFRTVDHRFAHAHLYLFHPINYLHTI
jgi:hypothetical protein